MGIVKKFITYALISLFLFILYLAFTIVIYGGKSNIVKSDAAIILGAGIQYDKPSPVFRERIKHGIALYKSGMVKHLIFTGGLGQGETFSESEVARIYAMKHGVQPSDIFIEKQSTITYENILEAQKLLHMNDINSILMVSDPLHMKRAMIMAQDLGISANTAPTPTSMYRSWSTKFNFLIREVYFYSGYLLHSKFT